jgi:hypothetical protein
MTTDKVRKRAVRTRMQKTGERYAAARRHVTAAEPALPPPTAPTSLPIDATATEAPQALPPRVADPGMTDESIRNGTGRDWDAWFGVLDAWAATTHTHTEIARYLHAVLGVPGWWAQTVTVGYERARGMRAKHQTTRGFEVSVSKTVAASVDDVWPFLVDAARRDRWLEPGAIRARANVGTVGRSAYFDVPADATRVGLYVTAKTNTKTVVTVTHEKLAGPDDVTARRVAWRARLDRLARVVAAPAARPGT